MVLERNGCAYCNSAFNLTQCQGGCMVVLYCSQEHQEAHDAQHRRKCEDICVSRATHLEERDRVMRQANVTDDWQTFVRRTNPGSLFLFKYTISQMFYRCSLSLVHTTLALESEMDLVKNWYVPSRNKPTCEAIRIAPFLIRLNRDDELAREYLDGLDISKFQISTTSTISGNYWKMKTRCNFVKILVRVRVAVDLRMLRMTTKALESAVPTEILDQIRQEVAVSPLVWKNRRFIESNDHDTLIQALDKDIIHSVQEIHSENGNLWGEMFKDGELTVPFKHRLPGGTEINTDMKQDEAHSIIRDSQLAWRGSPGAVDYLQRILRMVLPPCRNHEDMVALS
ncbi:zinc finger MYND domain-containing protein [Aspergillus melleus]|uniref:zinc finger MYND domain-containing protein n=1 Tax=Aspergillus melleus TaxID=138277 RepID=UPI001E8CF7AB|nr:uncharacterized protein LDX57_007011 [Aspergillus melleus]KAH8429345.1 hypothetical protein LDX57_007011 [Aspergillus melleus]